jgi:hypothetical protein
MQRTKPRARGLSGVAATRFTHERWRSTGHRCAARCDCHYAAGSSGLVRFGEPARLAPAEQVEVVNLVTRESSGLRGRRRRPCIGERRLRGVPA